MSASSVTGVGPGDSQGKQKPQHHSSCGCRVSDQKEKPQVIKKNGCYIKYSFNGKNKYKINSSGFSASSCF